MQRKNSCRRPSALAALLLLSLLCAVLVTGCTAPEKSPETVKPGSHISLPTENPADAIRTLAGTVVDATIHLLTVDAPDDNLYTFDKSQTLVETGEKGLLVGSPVEIRYVGDLDPDLSIQQVEILSIEVEDPTLPGTQGTELPLTTEARAQAILEKMSLEQKVGQMFIARCPDLGAVEQVTQYHLGGYILFGRDFEGKTPQQVTENIASYQAVAEVPMLIGVDEEGGTVTRVSHYAAFRATPFASPRHVFQNGGFDAIRSDTAEKSQLLAGLGINLNFAPVCDIATNPGDFMYDRSFGQDAVQTAQFVTTVVTEAKAHGVGSVLKHFPGYGNNADTHTGVAYDARPYETFVTSDFLPFQAGIDSGAEVVLVSHNVVSAMDDSLPASLSPRVHEILREELGFRGVISTDDLAMEGVRSFAGDAEVAVMAVLAGNDLLCCTDYQTQIPAVLAAAQNGTIPQEQIDQSVLRILEMKISMGIL